MIPQSIGPPEWDEAPREFVPAGQTFDIEISPEIIEELLRPSEWSAVLDMYASTVGLAAALTDCEGRQMGPCHNAQATWLAVTGARPVNAAPSEPECSFCVDSSPPCRAVKTALATGCVELVRDRAGFTHVAVPLLLGEHRLGALVAGQAFDRYPEPLPLQRLARNLGISQQKLWEKARLQLPVRTATLRVYGELLFTLGKAFVQQRYAAILDRRLATANQRLQLILDGIKDHALFTVDAAGSITSWNLGAQRIFGSTESEILGQNYSLFFTPEDIQSGTPNNLLVEAGRDGFVNDHGWRVRSDGTRFFAEGLLSVLGTGSAREFGRLVHDVTARRAAEEALRQSQKLESIGVLASGIAHDFNNLLTAIMGGVSFARTHITPEHPAEPALTLVEQASERAADLTHQLLAYGGHGKFVVTRFDLSTLIRDMLSLLHTSMPKTVKLELDLNPDLPWIEADASQIQQIVMNLVINGAESIGPEGGSLWVSTCAGGREVCMEVRDSGAGMTEETKARIFEPFFTTKFTGRGLGLAAVSGIVHGHQGHMHVESALGKGSTFRVCFPSVEKKVQTIDQPVLLKDGRALGAILVVDDEPSLRGLAKAILQHGGYEVFLAENGREAVDIFQKHADSITAVLLDMTMPVMNGEEAFHLIRAIRPKVPIVISTGYSEVRTRELFASGTVVAFMQKPYTAARLCEKIRITVRTAEAIGAG